MPTDTNTDTPPPSTATPEPRKKNTLRLGQIVLLHEWVTKHAADCRITSDAKLAQIAAAELEFTVTASNIASMREELGISKQDREKPPGVEEQLAALRQELEAVKQTAGESQALRGTLAELLGGLRALTERVNRLERLQAEPLPVADHPDLPGLPVPAFGETAPGTAGTLPLPGSAFSAQ